jgi:hypothetical protein
MNNPFAWLRSAARRNGSSRNESRRIGAFAAGIGAIALVAGILQTASAQETTLLDTQTTLVSSKNPSLVGDQVTYTATVKQKDTDTLVLQGSVTFYEVVNGENGPEEQAIESCPNPVQVDQTTGEAKCVVTYTAPGSHTIRAHYHDNTDAPLYNDSTSNDVAQTVQAASQVDLAANPGDNTAHTSATVSGQQVIYTATVSSASAGVIDTPTGTVTFTADGNNITTPNNCVAITLTSGVATCTTKFPVDNSNPGGTDGSYVVQATYTPATGSEFQGSTSNTITQSVSQASTVTDLSSQPTKWTKGQTVTFTAGVALATNSPSSGVPPLSGTVTFTDNGGAALSCANHSNGNVVTLSGASATCTHTFNDTNSHTITATYSGDTNYATSTDLLTQTVAQPYLVNAFITSESKGDPNDMSFKVSNGPARDYKLCLRLESWPSNVATPQPKEGGTQYWLNARTDRCKSFNWSSGLSSTHTLSQFGFATRGTYIATLKIGGVTVDTDSQLWDTWCPPNSLRNQGVWRPSRHKILDNCANDQGNIAKVGGRSRLDDDYGLRWMAGRGQQHVELVGRDYYYDNPTTSKPLLPPPGGGANVVWWGRYECDTYHGYTEFHPPWMQRVNGGNIHISGPQYSTKTPSVSGSWSAHTC